MTDLVHITACRLCDSPDLDLVVSFTPTPPGDQYLTEPKPQVCYPLDVMVCQSCGAVQLADTVDPKLIYPEYLYTTSVSKGLTKHFNKYATDVLSRLTYTEKRGVVDIGSNDGTLLRAFQRCGCAVLGIDPAAAIAERARANGIPTHVGFFSKQMAEELKEIRQADIITANHIMANVANLHDFIEGVKLLLAPDGTFVFETGYWPAIVDNNLIDTIEHEHLQYFAVTPLRQFFFSHGLTLVHAETNSAKGGSLRGYVQHEGAKRRASVGELQDAEFVGGYRQPYERESWVSRLKSIEQDMRNQIADADRELWVGYGAAVGSTLLLHQFGLGEKLTCLVDANPNKQGRFSPGYHLPVYPPGELARLKPDKIVILAWRYAEQIQAQHPEFAGKWILPLPQMALA